METGILEFLFKQIGTQGIWFALFLGCVFILKKEIERERTQSQQREDKLMEQLDKYNDQLGKNVEALERLERNFDVLNNKIDRIQQKEEE
jgi:hypothetical protein